MLMLFFTLVTCRDYDTGMIVNPENPGESMFEDPTIRGQFCQNKSTVMSVSAIFLFSIFFGKFWKSYIEKKKKTAELKQKRDLELIEKNKKNE